MMESSTTETVFVVSALATVILGSALAYVLIVSKEKRSSKIKNNKKDDSLPDACSISEEDVITPSDLDNGSYPGGFLSIIYGSQTGTAAGFAQQLCDESSNYGFKSQLVDMEDVTCLDEVNTKLLQKSFLDQKGKARIVVVVATYGEGESTDNATEMVRLLKNHMQEEQQQQIFSSLEYCVFGLGNRQYEHFNAMGLFFDKSLQTLGGTRVMEVGLGDDDQDLEGDFDAWRENMWMEFTKRYSPISIDDNPIATAKTVSVTSTTCPYTVEYLPEHYGNANIAPDVVPLDRVNKQTRHYFTATDCPISLVRELRSTNNGGSTLHIEVDVSSRKEEIQYETAANLAILPINNADIVDAVAKALSFDLDAVFRLTSSKGNCDDGFQHLFPTPCTVRDLLSRYCDLTTPPRRSELSALANYATNALDRKALQRMSSKEGREEYKEKIVDLHVGIADIVCTLCPSISMQLEHFIFVCPRLQPRFYTISSSSSLHPQSVHLTVGIMRGARKHGNGGEWFGVCSGHLSNIASNVTGSFGGANTPTCRIFVRTSSFRLPSDTARPIIMVGPGTGIAPMRAFLQERSYQKHQKNMMVGSSVLYFGCRRRDYDYLYEEELKQFQDQGVLTHLHVAFSREENHKVYVQHLIADHAKETWDLIDRQQASIYVCGGTKMGLDVTETITKVIADAGGKGMDGAKAYVDRLRSEGRFIQELWA